MATIYLPDDLLADVNELKRMHRQGKNYIILYNISKEETENKERTKENKEKEEREKKNYRKFLRKNNVFPTLEDVLEYGRTLNVSDENLKRFFNIYDSVGWVTEKNVPIRKWWRRLEVWANYSNKKNDKNSNRKPQAEGADAQAVHKADGAKPRRKALEAVLESLFAGDDRIARLAGEIDEMAEEMGVSTSAYSQQDIGYTAQTLLYRTGWCEGWTDEFWHTAIVYAKKQFKKALEQAAQKGLTAAVLNHDVLMTAVYEFAKKLGITGPPGQGGPAY